MNKNGTRIKSVAESVLSGCISIACFLVIWYIIASRDRYGMVPSPVDVFAFFIRSFTKPIGPYTMETHAYFSIKRVLVGYGAGILAGVFAGIGMGTSKIFKAIIQPFFEVIRQIPIIAWIPLSILWFGVAEMAKYFIIFLASFINVTLQTYDGVVRTDPILLGAAQMLGASQRQLLFKVIIPSSIPYIFTGMQTALSSSWMAVIAAEMIKATEGVGWLITAAQANADTVQILAGMIVIAVIGFLMAVILRKLERRLCAWNIRNT